MTKASPAMQNRPSGDYRIFVGAFPEGELAERLQALRRRHDPKTARITDPHVTLAGTYWRRGPATPENEAETIRRLRVARIQPFELVLGGIATFPPRGQVIYLQVEATTALLAARQVLLDCLGSETKAHSSFVPHLTLSMRLSPQASAALYEQLRASEWQHGRWVAPIEQLWLMQRGPADPAWRYIQCLALTPG